MTNVQNWSGSVAEDCKDSPACRNTLWATGSSRIHDDTGNPAVRAFRHGMRGHAGGDRLSRWELEGWAAAMWFTDAAESCGDRLTRACVERFMNRGEPCTADGLPLPARFTPTDRPPTTRRNCPSVARWSDDAQEGKGGWVTQGGDMTRNCFAVPHLPYSP